MSPAILSHAGIARWSLEHGFVSDRTARDSAPAAAPGPTLRHTRYALGAVDNRYCDRVITRHNTAVEIGSARRDPQGQETASSSGPDQAGERELDGSLRCRTIDANLSVASLLEGIAHPRAMAAGPALAAVPRKNGDGAGHPKPRRM
jgi:hypothetical protein